MRTVVPKIPVRAAVTCIAAALAIAVLLDLQVESRFRGRLFDVPAAVYSRGFELRRGVNVNRAGLLDHLRRLDYRRVEGRSVGPGEFAVRRAEIRIGRRPFQKPGGTDPGGLLMLRTRRSGEILELREKGSRWVESDRMRQPEFHS